MEDERIVVRKVTLNSSLKHNLKNHCVLIPRYSWSCCYGNVQYNLTHGGLNIKTFCTIDNWYSIYSYSLGMHDWRRNGNLHQSNCNWYISIKFYRYERMTHLTYINFKQQMLTNTLQVPQFCRKHTHTNKQNNNIQQTWLKCDIRRLISLLLISHSFFSWECNKSDKCITLHEPDPST